MSTSPDRHAPTPAFRDRLERQIISMLDEQEVIALPRRAPRWPQLRTAALVVIALGVGALGATASAQVQDARQREQLLAGARAELQLAAMRLELARSHAADARRRFEIGAVTRNDLDATEAELQRMQAQAQRSQLNVEEIGFSAAPPRDDLTAPLVRQRDFVTERLQLDFLAAQHRLRIAERTLEETQRRQRLGVTPPVLLLDAQAELARARADMAVLGGRVELRRQFLQEDLDPAEVARRAQRLELVQAATVAEQLHRAATERLTLLRRQVELGQARQVDVLRAELDASEKALELQQLMQQIERLRAGGE